MAYITPSVYYPGLSYDITNAYSEVYEETLTYGKHPEWTTNNIEWENYIPSIYGQGTASQFGEFSWGNWGVPVDKKTLFAGKMKSNLVITVKTRAPEIQQASPAERVALETLREVISESEFRKYLRYGSKVRAEMFRNRAHTKVWRNGKVVEEICVRIKAADIPPTDNVIAFRQIIQTSELEFKKLGNVYKMAA